MTHHFDWFFVSNITSNMLAFFMMSMLWYNYSWETEVLREENIILKRMCKIVLLSILADTITVFAESFTIGYVNYIIIYGAHLWLFIADLIFAPQCVELIMSHIRGELPKVYKRIMHASIAIGVSALLVNFAYPIVFRLEIGRGYVRGGFYPYFVVAAMVVVANSMGVYIKEIKGGGSLRFFPVWEYAIPATVGIIMEAAIPGISVIWSMMTIMIAGMVISFQNEIAYRDPLTGLYNRLYYDKVRKEVTSKSHHLYSYIMVDMNGFKEINDVYGHKEGDRALVAMAKMMDKVAGKNGVVIRIGGDEFLILLSVKEEKEAEALIDRLKKDIAFYNEVSLKKYDLSAAMGEVTVCASATSMDEIKQAIDAKMYEDKKIYYETHDRRQKK
ncbi:MAG: GGDEF domain-containing protein [Lachnospiraceae bacterium]|nr:GGDEF domain-containing protein [Lachnospiraceae bacterium]